LTKNLFYPGGVNYGIAATTGAYILVLNDDVELTPGFTAEMVRVMEASPRAAAVVPMMKLFYLRGFINGIGNHVRTKGWGSDNYVGYVDIGQLDDVIEVPSACVSAALLRREAIEAVGSFDAAYRAYYEDADWSFRMRRAGWTINAAPKALVYHKFSAFWKNMERKLKLAARNRLRFVLKNFDGRLRWAFLRSYMKEDLINILSLIKHRRNAEAWAYVRAYGSLILTLPDILDKRAAAKRTWKKAEAGKQGAAGSVEAILKLNPPQWSGMNADNVPRLDTGIYFAYYARQFAKVDGAT
jgi:GT2 family glycosyltransferase